MSQRIKDSIPWCSINVSLQAYAIFYLIMTGVSIFVLCAESVPEPWQNESNNATSENFGNTVFENNSIQHKALQEVAFYSEIITNIFFTFEWILRICVSPVLKAPLRKVTTWINLISITSSWIVLCAKVYLVGQMIHAPLYIRIFFVLRCLRIFRVLRIFNIIRGSDVLILALRDSMWEITILGVLFLTGMIIFAVLMFYAETSNPRSYPAIPVGFWWAIVTMTTVGYGDIYPTTMYGYVVGAACAIGGMFIASLPIPIISENFSKMRHGQRLLDDYQHSSRMTLQPLDKRKGVYICPVCYTRAFLDPHIAGLSDFRAIAMG